jgi:hypothetical protein
MKRVITIVLLAVFPAVTAVAGPAATDCSDEAYVYLSMTPRGCCIPSFGDNETYNIYVASAGFTDVDGLLFRLVTDRFGPEDIQLVSAPSDVTIMFGDVFNTIGLSFSSRHLDHDPVLTIEVSKSPMLEGDVETQDIYLLRGEIAEPVAPFVTFGYSFDCQTTWVEWFPPAEVEVPVGQDDSFCFSAVVDTEYPYIAEGYVQVVDLQGWIPDSFEQEVTAGCGAALCGWNFSAVTVPVHVPAGVADGATNEVTLRALLFDQVIEETTVLLRAVGLLATEPTTWGRVKALYR